MPSAWLIPVSGPATPVIELKSDLGPQVIGRHENCQIRLPADADQISRMHARVSDETGRWRIADLKSRWGTFLNGYKLEPNRDVPLNEGDLLRLTPWTFAFSFSPSRKGMASWDDRTTQQSMVRSIAPQSVAPVADALLQLLLQSAAAIHSAQDEKALAEVVIDAGIKGTGLPNAAMLRPTDAEGHIHVIASRFAGEAATGATFSRSLIQAASNGQVAELNAGAGPISQSIAALSIQSALCVPIMLGTAPAAFLYLDARGQRMAALRPNATGFCVALGNIASLALANLKRLDMEKRQSQMEAELNAAAQAQKWILPKRHILAGQCSILGESRPGQFVGGDFFDVLPLSDSRVAIALGDVSGKGISASVLMTAAQGFLHAALLENASPADAINRLNKFIHPRRPDNKFITLWLGVFDFAQQSLEYIDAAHAYAFLFDASNKVSVLSEGTGLPVGVDLSEPYTSIKIPLPQGGRCVVVSDGIIEQFDTLVGGAPNQQFGEDGVKHALTTVPKGTDPLAHLFHSVVTHANGAPLADDATAVYLQWT